MTIWDFASDEDPHIAYCAAGDYITKETLAAITLLRAEIPKMRVRFVNIASLCSQGIGDVQCKAPSHDIEHYFTKDKKVVINFHGYPQTIKQILFDYGLDAERLTIHGYEERGSTTTAFDMFVRNRSDRYHLVMEAFEAAEKEKLITPKQREKLCAKYTQKLADHRAYIIEHGADPEEITNWTWKPRSS
jgi:xylulose-5-phosphate/fructose-6-phosphate phosphoketolase